MCESCVSRSVKHGTCTFLQDANLQAVSSILEMLFIFLGAAL